MNSMSIIAVSRSASGRNALLSTNKVRMVPSQSMVCCMACGRSACASGAQLYRPVKMGNRRDWLPCLLGLRWINGNLGGGNVLGGWQDSFLEEKTVGCSLPIIAHCQ